MVAQAFNPSTWGRQRKSSLCEFQTSMAYRVSSRRVRAVKEKQAVNS